MSITPVTSVSASQNLAAAAPQARDAGEIPGAPDHDHDGDETATVQSAKAAPGHLDVKA